MTQFCYCNQHHHLGERDIEKSMKLLKSKKYDTVISIKETKDHPSRFKIFDKKKP